MATNLAMLAELVGGQLINQDAGNTVVEGAATLADAGPTEISLLDNVEKAHRLARSRAGAVVVPRDFAPDHPPAIQVDDVHRAFAAIVAHFRPERQTARIGVSPLAIVSPRARLDDDVEVHPGASIGDDARIGAHSTIHAGGTDRGAGCQD